MMGAFKILAPIFFAITVLYAAVPVSADIYTYEPEATIWINETDGDFTFGKQDFDAVGFTAPNDYNIKLVIRHKLNANDPALEQWGVWFYDAITGKTHSVRQDPAHLLAESEAGWVSSNFNLSKVKILDPLYANAGDWWFILREVTDGVDNTLMFDRARLVVTANAPIPGAIWLFGSGLAMFVGAARRKRHSG